MILIARRSKHFWVFWVILFYHSILSKKSGLNSHHSHPDSRHPWVLQLSLSSESCLQVGWSLVGTHDLLMNGRQHQTYLTLLDAPTGTFIFYHEVKQEIVHTGTILLREFCVKKVCDCQGPGQARHKCVFCSSSCWCKCAFG